MTGASRNGKRQSGTRVQRGWRVPRHRVVINRKLERLRGSLGLTDAECVVAALIAEAQSVPEIAARLDVSVNTVRTHLHRVYAKTGARRQTALARLLLTGSDRED